MRHDEDPTIIQMRKERDELMVMVRDLHSILEAYQNTGEQRLPGAALRIARTYLNVIKQD